jgi:hypothetical protein
MRHTLGFLFWSDLVRLYGPRIGIRDPDLDSMPQKMIALLQKHDFLS